MPWWGWVLVVAGAILLPVAIGMMFGTKGMSGGGGGSAAGGALGVFEEVFSPGRAEARQEQERDRVRKVDSAQGDDKDPAAPGISPAAATGPAPDTVAPGVEASDLPPGWLGATTDRKPSQTPPV